MVRVFGDAARKMTHRMVGMVGIGGDVRCRWDLNFRGQLFIYLILFRLKK
jgi:hypothetical protein